MKKTFLFCATLLATMPLAGCKSNATLTDDEMADKLVAAFADAIENHGSVKSAAFDHGFGSEDAPYEPVADHVYFGSNNAVHYTETSWGTVTDHYAYRDGDNVYGYNIDADGRVMKDEIYDDKQAEGINFTNMGLYNSNAGATYYDVESLAKLSADAAKENSQGDRVIEMINDNSYFVSFNATYTGSWEDTYYYHVELTAEFDATTKALAKLASKACSYYDVEVDENGIFEPLPSEYAISYTYFNYEATIGEREEVNIAYNINDFYYVSFGLSYDDQPVAENSTITVETDLNSYETFEFVMTDINPSTANKSFDNIDVTVVDTATGEETYDASGFVNNSGVLGMNFNASGTYQVTLKTRDFSFSFNVTATVSLPEIESFLAYEVVYVDDPDFAYYNDYKTFDETYTVGQTIGFRFEADPYGCDASCTVTLTCDGEAVTVSESTYDSWGTQKPYYVATLNSTGEYVLTVTSTVDPSVSSTFSFSVIAAE